MKIIEAKVVVIGSQGVGKTSVILRYTGKVFNTQVSPTIGASFFSCSISVEDYKVKMQVWDSAGQERFRAMAPMYYRNANAAFLVFDITSYESFMGMKSWLEELRRNIDGFVYLCILGNKCDLSSARQVKIEEAQEYAEMVGASYVETSALMNEGIEEAFLTMSRGLINVINNCSDTTLRLIDLSRSSGSPPSAPTFTLDKPSLKPIPPPDVDPDHTSCC